MLQKSSCDDIEKPSANKGKAFMSNTTVRPIGSVGKEWDSDDRLYANHITILPGSKVEFKDCKSGEKHTVTISEAVTVRSIKDTTINVEEGKDGEESNKGEE